jgi:iron complex outermembrane recepter protein
MKRFTLFTLMVHGIICISVSQEIADTSDLKEVVITASGVYQTRGNVTQKVEVITAEEISEMVLMNRNISEVLRTQTGASVSVLSRNDANWGTYGGIGPKYSTMMVNGLPVDAFVDPMTLDLMAVERVEYQKGPASIIYSNYLSQDFAGNQSPLAGTFNLIMKERFDEETTLFNSSYGSYNTANTQIYHQGIADRTHYFAGINYEMSDYTDYGIEGSWLNMKKNPEYKKTKVYAGATWFSEDQSKRFRIFANKAFHNGDAGRVYRGFTHNYGLVNAGYQFDINSELTLRTNVGYRNYDRSWQSSNFTTIDSLVSIDGVVQNIVPADVSLTFKHLNGSMLIAGIDYQGADYHTWSDPLVGYRSYGNKSTALQSGVYVQEELRFDGLTIRGGLRFNYIKNNIQLLNGELPANEMKEWNSLLYSGGVKYRISEAMSVYANVGTSFMTPGLKSVGGTIETGDTINSGQVPNPDLVPESGIGIDAGVDFRFFENIKLSVRGFMISVEDAIVENVVSQAPSQTMSVNAGKTRSTGGEVEMNHRLNDNLNWFINGTYMKSEIANPFDADQDGGTVPFSPELLMNAGLTLKTNFGLIVTPVLHYNDGYFDSSSKTGRQFFKPGVILNANISMDVYKSGKNRVSCYTQLYNLTDNEYEMPWQFKDTGFSMMFGIKAAF